MCVLPKIIIAAVLALGIIQPGCAAAQPIEPTRTLRDGSEEIGAFSVYSEPAGVEVRIDGQVIGKTPVHAYRLPAGSHLLRIQESEREIHISPNAQESISWFKGTFIRIPERKRAEPAPVPSPVPKSQPVQPQSEPAPAANDPFYWPLNPRGPIY